MSLCETCPTLSLDVGIRDAVLRSCWKGFEVVGGGDGRHNSLVYPELSAMAVYGRRIAASRTTSLSTAHRRSGMPRMEAQVPQCRRAVSFEALEDSFLLCLGMAWSWQQVSIQDPQYHRRNL